MMMCLEKIGLDLEEEKELGMQLDAEKNIRMNFVHIEGIVCLIHRLAEDI